MTVTAKPKIHVCGANGHLARLLIARCEHEFEVVKYSSKVSGIPSQGKVQKVFPSTHF